MGLELVKTQTIGTAVATVTVNDAFSATYDNYKIILSNGTSSAGANLQLRLAGITSTSYRGYGYYGDFGSGTINGFGPVAAGLWNDLIPTSTTLYSAQIEIMSPFLSQRKFGYSIGVSTGSVEHITLTCSSTSSATGFEFIPASGTLTGGTIRVYGYRNS
jgi:hypothetical protein